MVQLVPRYSRQKKSQQQKQQHFRSIPGFSTTLSASPIPGAHVQEEDEQFEDAETH